MTAFYVTADPGGVITMTDQRRKDVLERAEEWTQPERGTPFAGVKRLVQMTLLAVSIVAAVPTIITLYHAMTNDVPYSRVNHLLAQQKMWQQQGACMPDINFGELTTANGTKVFVGACPTSGDILFRLVSSKGEINHEWFPVANFDQTSSGVSLIDWLVSQARAGDLKAPAALTQLAQSSTFSVVCQATAPKNTMVRVVKEGGTCFKETMSLFTGAVTKREEVPCNATCTPTG
ncbi:MAG: hypothetical protein AAFZ05_05175 [Pseudomonadota bacterium]